MGLLIHRPIRPSTLSSKVIGGRRNRRVMEYNHCNSRPANTRARHQQFQAWYSSSDYKDTGRSNRRLHPNSRRNSENEPVPTCAQRTQMHKKGRNQKPLTCACKVWIWALFATTSALEASRSASVRSIASRMPSTRFDTVCRWRTAE